MRSRSVWFLVSSLASLVIGACASSRGGTIVRFMRRGVRSAVAPRAGTYRFKAEVLTLQSLKIRGYLGIALFGQTQKWSRTPQGS